MYTSHIKRTILLFITSLVMFSLCFSMHISATTSEPTENTSSEMTPSEEVSSETLSEDTSDSSSEETSEPVSSDSSESSDESTDSTDSAVSDESTTESEDSSISEQSTVIMSSVPISSGEVSSLVVSTVSDGGAPDYTYESEWNAKQSYVYEGSYVGLSSDTTSSQPEKEEIQTTNQSSTAQRYAKYAKIGMIVFGLLTIGCVAFLIYYNMKVRKSKKLHPEWYLKKEKVVPKHGKH